MTVNLTAMLVLTTMFISGIIFCVEYIIVCLISVSSSLPTTSYVKMVDIWLIFNLFLPFLEVLLHTYMDSLRSAIISVCRKDVTKSTKWIFPTLISDGKRIRD